MSNEYWWAWMILAAVFVVGEIFTAGFFLLWFGIGAAVAGVLALLGFGPAVQLLVFAAVSGVLFAVSRRFAEKWTQQQPSGVGADRLIGRNAVVLEEVNGLKGTGLVRVEREEWRARSPKGEVLRKGTIVEVVRIDGTHLVVKPSEEGE